MAFDTAAKRCAAAAVSFAYCNPCVTPDVSRGAGWRSEVGHSYSAFLTAPPPPFSQAVDRDRITRQPEANRVVRQPQAQRVFRS